VGDQECISCGECIGVCPTKAISWKGSKIFLKAGDATPAESAKTKKRRTVTRVIVAILMAAVLIGAIAYYWNQESTPNLPVGDAERGNTVGALCFNHDLEIVDGSGILTETVDPTATGKIAIINFWGTWCTPCVNELPYFDQIATEYADTVSVFAVHTNMISETAPAYIASYYPDSLITFARDYSLEGAEGYYTTLGGRGTYPYTVILDETGTITQIFVSSLTYDDLKQAVEAILNP